MNNDPSQNGNVSTEAHTLIELSALLEAVNRVQALIEFDLQGHILHANPLFLQTMGYTLEEVVGQHHRMFCRPDESLSAEYQALWRRLGSGETHSGQFGRVGKNGQTVWLQANYSPVLDAAGRPLKIVKLVTEVTDSKQRSAELEGVVKAMYRAMSIIEFDMDGNVLAVNRKFTELAGYTTEMMLNLPQKKFLPKSEAEARNHDALWTGLRAGNVVEKEFHRKHLNGKDLYVFSYYNPIFGPDGKPYKVMSFSTDLTERYAMERDLRDAKEKAEAATRAKSVFLATMSHELRTPMNGILGFTEILLDELLDEQHKDYLRTVHTSADSLLKLLNDILDTAELDYGAVELALAPLSLTELCRQTLSLVALAAKEKGLEVLLDCPADMPDHFLGDRLRLQQILTNLVGNAIKFTRQGQVRVACGYRDGMLQIGVQDTGIGIAQERLATIFEPFVQADGSMTRRYGGTGLGTTIARQLAELMGGHLEVSSQQGVGSTFTLALPLALSHPAP